MNKSIEAFIIEGYDKISEHGPFALGFFFGALLSYFFGRLASGEIKARMKIDLEREQQLLKQNRLKDERIDKLHNQIEILSKKRKGKS